jgi:hypothetical protein
LQLSATYLFSGIPEKISSTLVAGTWLGPEQFESTAIFSWWQENPYAQAAIKGAIATAVAITVKTVWTIVHPHCRSGNQLRVADMNVVLLYLLRLKGTETAFAELASLLVIQDSLVNTHAAATLNQPVSRRRTALAASPR